jgi:polyhydroxybutyrate depolymerase
VRSAQAIVYSERVPRLLCGRRDRLLVTAGWVGALLATLAGCTLARSSGAVAATSTAVHARAIPAGRSSQTVVVGGVVRTYHLYRPAHLRTPAPLVVMLHGGYGSGTQAENSYGWDEQADTGHFLVAYPDGLNRAWNTGGGCCGRSAQDNVNDIGFLKAMVSAIEHEAKVDPSRVYATGISNGGIMDYTLACHTTIFAAIGPDSATELGPCPAPTAISIIHIHGTADTHIPYNGGTGVGVAHINGPAIPALNATWRAIDRCAPPTSTTAGVVTTSIAKCPNGHVVELITISGAGHQWPGSAPRPIIEKLLGTDPPSTALNATKTIWQFFSHHRK